MVIILGKFAKYHKVVENFALNPINFVYIIAPQVFLLWLLKKYKNFMCFEKLTFYSILISLLIYSKLQLYYQLVYIKKAEFNLNCTPYILRYGYHRERIAIADWDMVAALQRFEPQGYVRLKHDIPGWLNQSLEECIMMPLPECDIQDGWETDFSVVSIQSKNSHGLD